jgi:penicillin-binding protein 1A
MKIGGGTLFGRLAFTFLLLCSIAIGAASGLLFVYTSDLPEIRALEDYRPDTVTELYADDGSSIGTFALQRRILLTYEQIPKTLKDAILSTEDQHFEEHWGVDFTRVVGAAWRDIAKRRISEGASTITMQLAGGLFLDRSNRSFRRKSQEAILALQIERHYTKQQILTMYCNQIYLGHGNYGFEAAAEYYFGKPVGKLTLAEDAVLAGMIRGPSYSPILHPERAHARRNLVLSLMEHEGKISSADAAAATREPMTLHLSAPRNNLAPYFVEEIRQYLERTYGTAAVHEQGLRVYTTLDASMQRIADQSVLDGLHDYDRRHGWRGGLRNILKEGVAKLDSYDSDDWHGTIEKGSYVTGLVRTVDGNAASVKIGSYVAMVSQPAFAWTGKHSPLELFKPGDLALFKILDLTSVTAKVELEQEPAAQGALLAIDNPTGEIKAMVGGRRCGRRAARSRFTSMRRRSSRVFRRSIPWSTRRFHSAAAARNIRRKITTKSSKGGLRCGGRWPIRAMSRRCGCSTKSVFRRRSMWRGVSGSPARFRRICRWRWALPILR